MEITCLFREELVAVRLGIFRDAVDVKVFRFRVTHFWIRREGSCGAWNERVDEERTKLGTRPVRDLRGIESTCKYSRRAENNSHISR